MQQDTLIEAHSEVRAPPPLGRREVFCHWEAIQTDDRWPKLEEDMKVRRSPGTPLSAELGLVH